MRTAVVMSVLILIGSAGAASAQTSPAVPETSPGASRFLRNSYAGLQFGDINYRFSSSQLPAGFQAQSVEVPHLAVRVALVGHEFNKYVSVQAGAMRPMRWVEYQNVNGDQRSHSVWMSVWGLTLKTNLPLTRELSAFGEAGVAIVSRKGFLIDQSPVVSNANYGTILVGGGLEYRVNERWSLLGAVTAVPGREVDTQPRTTLVSGGFNYTLRTSPAELAANPSSGVIWPTSMLRVGYITDAMGYGVNDFLSNGKVPIFWPGKVDVANGGSVNYERNVLHTRRFFALDWGASVSSWKSAANGERFYTASVYPVLRFSLVRTNPLDCYFSYSLAGPALITRTTIDGQDVGKVFTFQDYMGVGVFLGPKKRFTAEVRIAHYSNGNLFPNNPGVTIPLGFYLGFTF